VQRALGAPNQTIARRGSIFAAFLKLFPVYLFIIPGLICFALAKSGRVSELAGMVGADGKPIPSVAQAAFPIMVKYLLPPGLRGIVVAGLLSALMGSLAGVFNACSTLFTVDLYEKFRPGSSQVQLVRMGRIATAVMVVIALAWIPVIQGAHGLYGYLQAVQGYLAPPIFVVFFLGVFWKRLNARGCLWAMIVGFAIGIFRMLVDTPVTMKLRGFENGYDAGSFLWIVNNINFQYFSIIITLVSAVVMVQAGFTGVRDVLSGRHNAMEALSSQPHPEEMMAGLGSRYFVSETGIKTFSVGYPNQSPLDAFFTLRREHGLRAENVERIVVRLPLQAIFTGHIASSK